MSLPRRKNICLAAYSTRAAARISANSATFPVSGRNPRLKTPQQIIAELEKLRECGMTDTVYFVDDNFIGNRKAALDLLPHLVEWQKKTGYVTRLAWEATLNIAKRHEILELMREAMFVIELCGNATP